jgi:hypothetical protein
MTDNRHKVMGKTHLNLWSLPVVRKLLHFNLFPETTGTIILKRGRSVHLIVLIKVFSSQFFNQWEAIFNIRQGQWTQFWKRGIQRVSHQSLVQFDPVVLEKIKMFDVHPSQSSVNFYILISSLKPQEQLY